MAACSGGGRKVVRRLQISVWKKVLLFELWEFTESRIAKMFTPPGRRRCHDTTLIIYPNDMKARKASVNTQNGESLIAHYSF